MMTDTIAPADQVPAAPASPKRRRVVGAVAVVVLLATAVGVVLVHRSITRPLLTATEGNRMGAFPGEHVEETFDERDVRAVPCRHGETFEFTLNNPSRWDVRVTDLPAEDLGMLEPVRYSIDTTPFDSPDRTFTPFRPFTIRPGGSAMVRIEARFDNCDRYGTGHFSSLVGQPIRYRALWASKTRSLGLPTTVQVLAPENCPAS